MSNLEIETTLAICSETPELLLSDLASLTEIGEYKLLDLPTLAIQDTYLDLADQSLRESGIGMRVRLVNGSPFVTIKGRSEELSGGGKSREEIELPWSEDALTEIVDRLSDFGVTLAIPVSSQKWNDPLAVVAEMGLAVEQRRDTKRRPRIVVNANDPRSQCAELAIDSVVYHLRAGDIRHHELEIEVVGDGVVDTIQIVSTELLGRWRGQLRYWKPGKRATGGAVEELLLHHGTEELVSETGDLLPRAYDLIEAGY